MKNRVRALLPACMGLSLLALSSPASSKSYKSGELETRRLFGFGAFEARIRSAQGPGVISTFFLWRPGSETSPTVPWHEIDFEMGQASGDYQTQIMTPGPNPPRYRKVHERAHSLPTRAWQAYYTYRMEWTPTYIAFFVDGREVRRETDPVEYAEMFHQDSSGDTPANERMELRTGAWPGNESIASWSGVFDGSHVPTGHFVDYVKVWDYTPNQTNKFATLLMDEQFNTLNTSVWYPAQWTFDFSASDYVAQNVGVLNGKLVVALTTDVGQGILPKPPRDLRFGPAGFVIEAEDYDTFRDSTRGNQGTAACSSTDVDAQPTTDPAGGNCNVGWTTAGEWLEYNFELPKDEEYVLTVRQASLARGTFMHVEVDGVDVSGPIEGPGAGWQAFQDAAIPGVLLAAGPHVMRVVFETGDTNVNYLSFAPSGPPPSCEMSCDDGNVCTNDTCDPLLGCVFTANSASCADDGNVCTNDVCAAGACTHPSNSASCADDGDACTNDVCSSGACTHPSNGSCGGTGGTGGTGGAGGAGGTSGGGGGGTGGTGASPCAGLCASPTTFSSVNYSSGNLGTGAACFQTMAALHGGVCGNLASSRRLSVNGAAMTCNGGNWPSLPAKRNGGYCVQTTPGDYPWAYFVTW